MPDGFDPNEMYQSRVPTIQTLVALGFQPLSQVKINQLRGKIRSVILDDIVVEQMLRLNSYSYRGSAKSWALEQEILRT